MSRRTDIFAGIQGHIDITGIISNAIDSIMKKREASSIVNDHYRQLKKRFKLVIPDFDQEGIHQFRVAYKKLRAFLRVISQANKNSGSIKIYNTVKKAYKVSGNIRDLQLHRTQILETTKGGSLKPAAYLALVGKEIDKQKLRLAGIFLKRPFRKHGRKSEDQVLPQLQSQCLRDFVARKWKTVNELMERGHLSDDAVHSIRKNFKDLLFALKMYEKMDHDTSGFDIWNGKDECYFATRLDDLGKFQDKCASIDLMKQSGLGAINREERELLLRIKKQWTEEKAGMRQALCIKLKTDFEPQKAGGQMAR